MKSKEEEQQEINEAFYTKEVPKILKSFKDNQKKLLDENKYLRETCHLAYRYILGKNNKNFLSKEEEKDLGRKLATVYMTKEGEIIK